MHATAFSEQDKKKTWPVIVVKEVLAKPKRKTINNPRLMQTYIVNLLFCFSVKKLLDSFD